MRLRQLLKGQDGITLIMAVAILGVLSLSGATLIYYSGTNARSAEYSTQNASAYDLAEAGIDEMMAVLSKPTNNASMPDLLPETSHEYDGGTVTWSGTLDQLTQTWSVTSTGRIDNPTGQGASEVTRTLTAKIPVTPTLTQPLNNPAWNYIYATRHRAAVRHDRVEQRHRLVPALRPRQSLPPEQRRAQRRPRSSCTATSISRTTPRWGRARA